MTTTAPGEVTASATEPGEVVRELVEHIQFLDGRLLPDAKAETARLEASRATTIAELKALIPTGPGVTIIVDDPRFGSVPVTAGWVMGRKPPASVNVTALRQHDAVLPVPCRMTDVEQPPKAKAPSVDTVREWRRKIPDDVYDQILSDPPATPVFEVAVATVDEDTGEVR